MAFLVSLILVFTVIVVVTGYAFFAGKELSFEDFYLAWPFLLLPTTFVIIFYFEKKSDSLL